MSSIVLPFEHQRAVDKRLVGGKAHGLAVMTQAGITVSPGFTFTTHAYQQYLEQSGLRERIRDAIAAVDHNSIDALDEMARHVKSWFDEIALSDDLMQALTDAYGSLCDMVGVPDVSVAVRSSATAEDSAGASFAGEYETYVGMCGIREVELHVRRCWSSAFSARALSYVWKNAIDPMAIEMAVVIQKTVNARAAGVLFTVSPVTGDRSRIVIEASYGLGLGVVGGEVTPDRYVVAKVEGQVMERVVGDKHIEYLTNEVPTLVELERRTSLCLEDAEVLGLAKIGKRLERLHGAPQDIEFAIDRDLPPGENLVLLQCRPITVLPSHARQAQQPLHDALTKFASSVISAAK